MRDAPTRGASKELKALVEPGIHGKLTPFGQNAHTLPLEVGPESSVATTQGTIALRESSRPRLQFELDGTAMT
jgi:hypothetical protein